MNQANRDYFNDFVSVEIAQAVSRIVCKYNELAENELKESKPAETEDVEFSENQKTEYQNEWQRMKEDNKRLEEHKGRVLEMYWGYMEPKEIAHALELSTDGYINVQNFLACYIPISLIYQKHKKGMLPSRIARLVDVNLTTNEVRRVLNLDKI